MTSPGAAAKRLRLSPILNTPRPLMKHECEAIYTFAGEVRIDSAALRGSGASMNDILRTAKIPLATSDE